MTIPYSELQKLSSRTSLLSLYTLDATAQGGSVYNITNEVGNEARVNLLNYSQSITNTAWLKVRTTIDTTKVLAPDGTITAEKMFVNGTTAPASPYYYITQTVPANGLNTFTVSCHLKSAELTNANIRFDDGAGVNTCTVSINLSTGVPTVVSVAGNASNPTVQVTNLSNGWFRLELTCTWGSITTVRAFVRPAIGPNLTTDLGFVPTAGQGIYVWGVQLEANKVASVYQQTSTTAFSSVQFGGTTYIPFPISIQGVDHTGTDAPPKPRVTVSNVVGMFLPEIITTKDLVGAKFTRIRVLSMHLDGRSTADPTMFIGPEVFYIEQKVSQNRTGIVWQLTTNLDRLGLRLPRRQILKDKGFPAVSRVRVPG